MTLVLLTVANYLIGSISSAVIIGKLKGIDIRKEGYKTAGGSNTAKVLGIKWGIFVGIFDLLKGIPLLFIAKSLDIDLTWQVFIGLAAVCGHNWPIYFNFSGGRGLATIIGVMLILDTRRAIIPIIIFLLTLPTWYLGKKGRVKTPLLGSPLMTLTAMVVYCILTLIHGETDYILLSTISLGLILIRRVSARLQEYRDPQYNPAKLFISRLVFDDNTVIK